MKKILCLFLIVLCGEAITAQQLLKNGNFDNGSQSWTTACTGIEAYANETSYGGLNTANRVAEIDDQSCFYQDICVFAGKDYQFSMTASRRTGNGGSPNPLTTTIKIDGLNAANNIVTTYVNQSFTRTNTTFALTNVSGIPLISVPVGSGVVKLRVTLTDNTSGTSTLGMIIDSLSLIMLAPPAITAKDTICRSVNHAFSISNLPSSGVTYAWDFGVNATPAASNVAGPSVQWTASGIQQVKCVLSNGTCDVLTLNYSVYVLPDERSSRTYRICPGNSILLTANGVAQPVWNVLPGGDDLASLNCANCIAPEARPSRTTTYYASSAMSNGCFNIDTVLVKIDSATRLDILPAATMILCTPDSVHLSAVATGPRPFVSVACGTTSVVPFTTPDTIMVIPSQSPRYKIPGSFASPTIAGAATVRHQYLVKASDLKAIGLFTGTIGAMAFRFIPNASATTIRNVKISMACTDLQALDAANGFVAGTSPVYASPSVTIGANQTVVWFPFTTLYNKDTGKNLVIDICYTNAAVPATVATTEYTDTKYTASLYAYASTGDMCNGGASPVVSGINELPVMMFGYYPAVEGDFSFRWSNGVFIPSDTISDPSLYVSETDTIIVMSAGKYGCLLTDSLIVIIPQGSQALNTNDTSICKGASVSLTAANGDKYAWYENGYNIPGTLSCNDCATPVATPVADTRYNVIISEYGCADTFDVAIAVTPYPDLIVNPSDTLVTYLKSIRLQAAGADKYIWTSEAALSATDIPDPVAIPDGERVYTVKGYFEKNPECFSTAQVHVNVDYRANLFVPTAFTPNGDGINDVFRVANITFQDVPEFRVYNRWGKEIFAAADNKGWDGTFNGLPQELGVYYYIIKVVIPDGTEVSYKGEVTLLR